MLQLIQTRADSEEIAKQKHDWSRAQLKLAADKENPPEHLSALTRLTLSAVKHMVRPGGRMFIYTTNRNPIDRLTPVLGAE